MSASSSVKKQELVKILNAETSKMPWSELQRFFASGNAVFVHESLDLVDTAAEIALDNKDKMKAWMDAEQVGPVTDKQAAAWWEEQRIVWAVVVAPWVFVQLIRIDTASN